MTTLGDTFLPVEVYLKQPTNWPSELLTLKGDQWVMRGRLEFIYLSEEGTHLTLRVNGTKVTMVRTDIKGILTIPENLT